MGTNGFGDEGLPPANSNRPINSNPSVNLPSDHFSASRSSQTRGHPSGNNALQNTDRTNFFGHDAFSNLQSGPSDVLNSNLANHRLARHETDLSRKNLGSFQSGDWGLSNDKNQSPFYANSDGSAQEINSRPSSASSYGSADSGASYPPGDNKKGKKVVQMRYSDFKEQSKSFTNEGYVSQTSNQIEAKYRRHLNRLVQSLRKAIPKEMLHHDVQEVDDSDEDKHELKKVSKSKVMEMAVKYIKSLEEEQQQLQSENDALQTRLGQLETSKKRRIF